MRTSGCVGWFAVEQVGAAKRRSVAGCAVLIRSAIATAALLLRRYP